MALREATRTYLEMTDPSDLRSAPRPEEALGVQEDRPCPIDRYRFLYEAVGKAYYWVDRLRWTDAELRDHLASDAVSVCVLSRGEDPAGFYELQRHSDASVEIAYFGLLAGFHGRGWGKWLLSDAVRRAWHGGARRVWLHTCTLDGPAALPNYLARGFRAYREVTYTVGDRAGPP